MLKNTHPCSDLPVTWQFGPAVGMVTLHVNTLPPPIMYRTLHHISLYALERSRGFAVTMATTIQETGCHGNTNRKMNSLLFILVSLATACTCTTWMEAGKSVVWSPTTAGSVCVTCGDHGSVSWPLRADHNIQQPL